MPKKVFDQIEKEKVEIIDLRFVDIFGKWQHFSTPASFLSEKDFKEGIGFDGSSIKGFKPIEESDLILIPEPETAFIDPFFEHKTLCLICDVYEPGTRQPFIFDPRFIAKKAQKYLESTGLADKVYLGPEAEFFIFDSINYFESENQSYYKIDSAEAFWNSGLGERNLGYKIRAKEGYFPVPPNDTLQDLRSEITRHLINAGIEVEKHHHEVATAGQSEIDMKYDELLAMADKLMKFKYIVKATCSKAGRVATFMPKPIFSDNGSGMHTHISLWQEGQPLFAGDKYGGLSEMALYFIGGLLKHAGAVLAFASPTTNSYKRLVPGYEAPVNLAYSQRNRSAAIRIPVYSDHPSSKRLEFRPPDPAANPYLAFSAILLAGLDGIQNKIDPGKAYDSNIFELTKEEAKDIKSVPGSLVEALACLNKDREFLTESGVFTDAFIDQWIDLKTGLEADPVRLRPHPHEFLLYHDC
ncbi:MAG: type I glutamate--ammonia ligase [Candidatus Buchananbacteria bacterium RIFCSPHIGHO2_01_FULL_46_12]|uniref:Glutamine synthetase n=2 Tax=Candidatus Buchananiibacteriota TaxID=1817903 RepID=A0A1G1YBH5_9BACT|nr:MAG: type I glutamate--ammonia ligase [Candidatus Buchananbacteria bacterium RIFCSPHIGHO2_01_FULL_46_12]OGY57342.1 MAG: type I glutamate--ammonia ligase [Candidatus Buchananbacteria bacterium RIFCSPLOWO2_02_FULL_46_11b]